MSASTWSSTCRSCGAAGLETIADLGSQPDPDQLLDDPSDVAPEAVVHLVMCPACGLVQLAGPRPDGPRPPHGHAMPVADGDPWVELISGALGAGPKAVCDVDGSGGMPASAFAAGGPILQGLEVAQADLVLLGHALNHVDDIDETLRRCEAVLAPAGLIAIDFHHVLGLVQGQVDVISHTHRCYLSLHALERALARHGLAVRAVREIAEFGGTIRVVAGRDSDAVASESIDPGDRDRVRATERVARLDVADGFANVENMIREGSRRLRDFLDDARASGSSVVGYGASSRGTTFLNMAGVDVEALPLVVDRAVGKQGKYLPRARIPVAAPSDIDRVRPDHILVLPWPSAPEISRQLAHVGDWGARFVVPLPTLQVL